MRERFERLNIRPSLLALIAVLVLVLVATVVYHFAVYLPQQRQTQEKYTNYTAYDNTPQRAGERTLLAELSDGSIKLYSDGDYIILEQNGFETEFDDWNENFANAKPQLECYDFNHNGNKDIVILAPDDRDEYYNTDTYGLYVLTPSVDAEGKYDYAVYYTNSSGWYSKIFSLVHAQLSQPKVSPKRTQLVMDYREVNFNYNVETGLPYNHEWSWFVTSPKTADKTAYCTVKDWDYGPCMISLDKNLDNGGAKASIDVYVDYNELSEPVVIGSIDCVINISNGNLSIGLKSLHFTPDMQYYTTDPLKTADSDWSRTYTNGSTAAYSGKVLSALSIGLPSAADATAFSVGGVKANANAIDRIVLTNKEIKLYAKSGISFDEALTKLPNYEATIIVKENVCSVVEGAAISTEGGQQVLTLKLDKSYPQSELTDITLTLGKN